jgi:hypothetical protein
MLSAKRPPQHCLSPIEILYLSQLLKISLLNELNKISEKGQSWRTPFLILNDSDNCLSTLTQALEDNYKFSINLEHLPLLPIWWIFIYTLYMGTVFFFFF